MSHVLPNASTQGRDTKSRAFPPHPEPRDPSGLTPHPLHRTSFLAGVVQRAVRSPWHFVVSVPAASERTTRGPWPSPPSVIAWLRTEEPARPDPAGIPVAVVQDALGLVFPGLPMDLYLSSEPSGSGRGGPEVLT